MSHDKAARLGQLDTNAITLEVAPVYPTYRFSPERGLCTMLIHREVAPGPGGGVIPKIFRHSAHDDIHTMRESRDERTQVLTVVDDMKMHEMIMLRSRITKCISLLIAANRRRKASRFMCFQIICCTIPITNNSLRHTSSNIYSNISMKRRAEYIASEPMVLKTQNQLAYIEYSITVHYNVAPLKWMLRINSKIVPITGVIFSNLISQDWQTTCNVRADLLEGIQNHQFYNYIRRQC